MGKWRAAVLIGVHVLIAIHVLLWMAMGRTMSPVEPSEAMQTLELGLVNAGFVFFALALLSTLIFGRYFCGWACHVVALQDLCAWIMKKCGIHPRPFRSRLLLWVPLIVALYMFVWPTFKRHALFPALEAAGLQTPFWLKDVAPFTGFTNEFIVEDFWATFVPWYLAIPYLFVVGFAVIYFLGAKGFCTYGCPYGGFFAPLDKLSPGRIRVTDACDECGYCTAVCTSNVRVHEEVRDFGMVIDPGCMKCLDCVSACPNDALYFGFGKPAIGAKVLAGSEASAREAAEKRARRWDLSWPEEIAAGILFLAMFFAFRQFFYVVPMLMAVGLAGIGTFVTWKLTSLLRQPNVKVQNLQLKLKGRWKPAGVAFAGAGTLLLAAAAWGGLGRWHLWQGGLAHNRLDVPIQAALRPEFVPRARTERLAAAVANHLQAARLPWEPAPAESDGRWSRGVGYGVRGEAKLQHAYALVLLGRSEEALAILRQIIERGEASDELVSQALMLTMTAEGGEADSVALLQRAVEVNPDLVDARRQLALHLRSTGRAAEAQRVWETPAAAGKNQKAAQAALDLAAARFHLQVGDAGRCRELAERAAAAQPTDAGVQIQAAIILINSGDQPGALARVESALAAHHPTAQVRLSAAEILAACGKQVEAEAELERALERGLRDPGVRLTGAALRARWGQPDAAAALVEEAIEHGEQAGGARANVLIESSQMLAQLGRMRRASEVLASAAQVTGLSVWDRMQVGRAVLSAGLAVGDESLIRAGLECFTRAAQDAGDSPTVLHDAGQAHLAAGEVETGLDLLTRAAALGENNAALAGVLAEALASVGQTEEAERWRAEALRRSGR